MRLLRLRIPDYKVLSDLEIAFSPAEMSPSLKDPYTFTMLVGNNGSGKSTLLQAVATVFRQISDLQQIHVPFDLEYLIQDRSAVERHVRIEGRIGQQARWTVDHKKQDGSDEDLLPERIVYYTTGRPVFLGPPPERESDSNEAEPPAPEQAYLFEQPYTRQLIPDGLGDGSSRILQIRQQYLPLVMVCGWLVVMAEPGSTHAAHRLRQVFDEAGVDRISGFSLGMRLRSSELSSHDRERLGLLHKLATRVETHGTDQLLVFDFATDPQRKAQSLLRVFGGNRLAFFEQFVRWFEPLSGREALLQEVSVFVERKVERQGKRKNDPMLHLFDWLSDGEQSFLARMAMLSLVATPRCLVLVDEPEVHFNDFWKRQIVYMLHKSLGVRDCHILMATHSSIALTDVKSRNVRVLEKEHGVTTRALAPSIQTYAADPSDIMVHVFQAPYAIGQRSQEHLESFLDEIREVRKAPGRVGFQDTAGRILQEMETIAPGYWRYKLRQALSQLEDTE